MKSMKTHPLLSLLFVHLLLLVAERSEASVVDRNGARLHDGTLSSAAVLASKDAHLTIDASLQNIVEEELAHAQSDLHAQKIIAILADPKTGEILAMASRPGQPSEPGSLPQPVSSEAVSFNYEPGSTFKMVACAGFLKAGLGDEKIFCENGACVLGGKTLRDHKPYGDLTPLEVLVKSSNIGSAKMALKLGKEKFRETAVDFGFGRKTDIALFDESPGIVLPMEKLDDLALSRMGFGQSVAVTPIQVLMAYAAIANDGLLLPPTLVLAPKTPMPTGVRILPEAIAGTISKALVVDDLSLARVEGLSVAGKTGTAQAVNPLGEYAMDQYVTSFVGYFPAENPKAICLVVVDQAKVDKELNYGGLTAAPIFSRIAERSASYLHIINP